MTVEDCLPPELRGPATTVAPIAAGLSGAGVYRVESAGRAFVLKIASEAEDDDDWRRGLHYQQLAANAGLSPRVVHVDEARRAIVTDFVVDRSLSAFYGAPSTREAALALLGRTARRIHALALSEGARGREPRTFLTQVWGGLGADFALPGFARDAVGRVLSEGAPAGEPVAVVSHNDLNPTNLVYDGETIVVLDWAAAGPNDRYYDLATLAVFLRVDDGACLRLLSAYEGEPVAELPDRFASSRRLVAALAGTMQLYLARGLGHPGATEASALSLGEFYQQLRAGAQRLGTPEGQWAFGLALLNESLKL